MLAIHQNTQTTCLAFLF